MSALKQPAPEEDRLAWSSTTRAVIFRAIVLGALWCILAGLGPSDIVVGVFAVAVALATSLTLLPPDGRHFSASAIMRFAVHFLASSLAAGLDVMRRAFDPRLPLQTGFVTCPCDLGGGIGRDAFRAVMTLQPGSLPVRDLGADGMVLHCLDVSAPHGAAFRRAELGFSRLVESERGDG